MKATKSALDRQSIEPQARYNGIEITEDEQASLSSEVDQNVAQTKQTKTPKPAQLSKQPKIDEI
jgi:hypothetical protein